ncbi:nuclear transport factor 2 family protein [Novosphingobium sp. PS1R-30]|uniref:Nuclear transport factor 2 family protein n=1 Tax=Novosphingobium anseongense TaxID=3133436 RepID=A0ABU8S2N5_9SPHN
MRKFPLIVLLAAAPLSAVPPPPPVPVTLEATQNYIRALTSKDRDVYDALLAEDFVGHDGHSEKSKDRATWLSEISGAFASPGFHVTVLNVFQGGQIVSGQYRQRAMVVERVTNFATRPNGAPAGDCCVFYLTETITFDGGQIDRIDRSPFFENALSKSGERTDLNRRPGN